MHYQPEMSGVLAMKDDDFNQLADRPETILTQQGSNSFNPIPGAAKNGPARATGPRRVRREEGDAPSRGPAPQPGGQSGGVNQPAAAVLIPGTDPNAPPQRGFIITMLVRTPFTGTVGNIGPTEFIAAQVATKLRAMKLIGGTNPQADFSIERVTIPGQTKISVMTPGGTAPPAPQPILFTIPPDVTGGTIPPPPPAPLAPATPTALDLFPDPMRPGEAVGDDSLVTVLVAVNVDPPKPPPTAGTPAPR
jgi:hypothetical protein